MKIDRTTRWEDLPDWLSPEEARRYLGIGRSTIYDALAKGQMAHRRFGRRILIPRSALPRPARDAKTARP